MGKIKDDFSYVSINQLVTLTGKTSRTLKKILADVEPSSQEAGSILYIPSEVLPIIYDERRGCGNGGPSHDLNPIQEKARLDKLKADKVQIEIDVLKETLIPIERVEQSWSKLVSAFRSKILAMPSKLSPRVCAVKEIKEVEKILKAEVNEALTELSEFDGGLNKQRTRPQGS